VLDLTFCQRNDDLVIIITARSVQGTTPTRNGLVYPFLPLCLGDRARNI